MKTIDGFILNEGEQCFVSIQSIVGNKSISSNPRPAVYMNEWARERGFDFQILKAKFESEDIEVIGVWKERPKVLREH